jgi:uncharacterized protein DUF4383
MTTRWEDTHVRVRGRQPVQVLAGLVGVFYLVIGAIGFSKTGVGNFTGYHDVLVLGFLLNPLQNLIHVVTGVLGLLLALKSALARLYGWFLFVGFGFLSFWGVTILGTIWSNATATLGNPLNLNMPANWLHIGTALLGLVMAIMPARKMARVPVGGTPGGPTGTTAEERPAHGFGLHRRKGTAH